MFKKPEPEVPGSKYGLMIVRYADLMDIVILGDPKYMAKEWKLLRNFSKVYFVAGSVLSR